MPTKHTHETIVYITGNRGEAHYMVAITDNRYIADYIYTTDKYKAGSDNYVYRTQYKYEATVIVYVTFELAHLAKYKIYIE